MAQFFPWILPEASSFAGRVDFVFWLITLISVAVFAAVSLALLVFVIRFRQGSKVNRALPEHQGIALEMTWTILPLIIFVGIFFLSTIVYFPMVRPPANSTEIFVVAKQWMWKIQHPDGRWEMNELHVPVGQPVKLTMISEDVIHDFGVPSFRINMDVVPGRYTQTWFEPTRVGDYHLFCAQFCGTNHAIMGGYIHVMEPDAYEKWAKTGNINDTTISKGETLFREQGCTGCHGPSANVRAPSLVGIYNQNQPVQVPNGNVWNAEMPVTTQVADYRYLHDSIYLPAKEIVAGYRPIMPSFQGRLSEEQVLQLVDYIRSLRTSTTTGNGAATGYQPFANDDPSSKERAQGLRNPDGTPQSTIIGQRQLRIDSTHPDGGNANGINASGDAASGKPYGGSPTGDMSDPRDRDAVMRKFADPGAAGDAASGKPFGGSPTGDMSNVSDRDNVLKGGGAASNSLPVDISAGGMNNRNYHSRGGVNVYGTKNYTDSNVPVYTGGLHSAPVGGDKH